MCQVISSYSVLSLGEIQRVGNADEVDSHIELNVEPVNNAWACISPTREAFAQPFEKIKSGRKLFVDVRCHLQIRECAISIVGSDMCATAKIIAICAIGFKFNSSAKRCHSVIYLIKPFDMKELLARIRAIMRRPPRTNAEIISAGPLSLNLKTFQLTKNGTEVVIIPKEFALVEFFMKHLNEVFNIDTLMERLWPSEAEASPEVVRTYISRLRQKLEAPGEPTMFQTVHRVGYKFVPPH